ncbi:MAG: class I SAM-dependent methyltransferase [Verrucomicrobia bacterium]|nr:class I SAM-dependent methyltransferase [Verrucomicrobiota bacterium]
MRSIFGFIAFWCSVALISPLAAQPSGSITKTNALYELRAPSRDGIGKFYMGREISHVMGHQGAEWLERPEREAEEKTDLLIESLKFRKGEVVADIGAGTGYLTWKMAKAVGTNGTVYAVEIQQEMLDILTNRLTKLGIHNVKPALGSITDPKLPPNSVDTIIMVDVYHEFDHPHEMMQAMSRALRKGGRMVFVEYRAEDPDVPIKPLHKMTEAQVRKEAEVHPLAWHKTISVLPRQHIIIFKKR